MSVPTWKTEYKQVAPNIYAYIQGGGPGIDNTGYSCGGLIVGDDACMVVDTLQAPLPANAFIAEIKKTTNKPIRHVVNTHGHSDHASGNQFFMQAFHPEIIGSDKTRELTITMGAGRNRTGGGPTWLAAAGLAVGDEVYHNTPATVTIPVGSTMTMYYGGTKLELYAVEPAHTLGDIIVYAPQQKVIFGGDCCIFDVGPIGGGSGLGMIRVLEWMMTLDADWVVPGHGPVGTKKDVQKNLDYFVTIRDGLKSRMYAGLTPGAAAAAIEMGEFDQWPDANRYFANAMRMWQDLTGKTFDQAETAAARDEYQKLTKN